MSPSKVSVQERLPVKGFRLGRGSWIVVVVGLLVPLVSMNRLEVYARNANETDAVRALGFLSGTMFGEQESLDLEQAMESSFIAHRLSDARRVETGLWSYHGYLFCCSESEGQLSLVAWPREWGASGRKVYAAHAAGGVSMHANTGGLWSGSDAMPIVQPAPASKEEAVSQDAWRPLRTD